MKTYTFLIFITLAVILSACSNHSTSKPTEIIYASDCLNTYQKDFVNHADSINYSYQDGILDITHFNAGFNCCPGGFKINTTVEEGLIIIEETEDEALCDCLCLFEIHYRITGITTDCYKLSVIEPYLQDGNQLLEVELNLQEQSYGGIAIERNYYPWTY